MPDQEAGSNVAVTDEDELYRRLAPGAIRPDGTVSRVAFMRNSQPDNEISVDLARVTTPAQALAPVQGRGFGLGTLVAGYARSLGFAVRPDPLPDNPAHTLIVGQNSRALSRLLADHTRIIVPPQ